MRKIKRRTVEEDIKFIISNDSPDGIKKEYRSAAKNLIKLMKRHKRNSIIITSSNSGEGKSLCCVNLAAALADLGKTVLVVDGNIRNPYIHSLFGLPNERGLTSVLREDNFPASTVRDGIYAITSGPSIDNIPEHLGGVHMERFINSSETWYDYILIDMPDIKKEEVLAMNKFVAGILLVIRENYTRHDEVIQSLKRIKGSGGVLIGFLKSCCIKEQKQS